MLQNKGKKIITDKNKIKIVVKLYFPFKKIWNSYEEIKWIFPFIWKNFVVKKFIKFQISKVQTSITRPIFRSVNLLDEILKV